MDWVSEAIFWLVPCLVVGLVGGLSGWAGYYMGYRYFFKNRTIKSGRNLGVAWLVAGALIAVAWFVTLAWPNHGPSPSVSAGWGMVIFLTFYCVPAAAVVAYFVIHILARRKQR